MPQHTDEQGRVVRRAGESTSASLQMRALGPRASKHRTPPAYLDHEHDLTRYAWYHGNLSKDEAEVLLSGAPSGAFLVRNRSSKLGHFVLVWKQEGNTVTHILVRASSRAFVDAKQRYEVQSVDHNLRYYATVFDVVRTYAKQHMTQFVPAKDALVFDPALKKLRADRGDPDL